MILQSSDRQTKQKKYGTKNTYRESTSDQKLTFEKIPFQTKSGAKETIVQLENAIP